METEDRAEIEVGITRELYKAALLDGTRALVVQNSRFAKRGDPFSRVRTPKFQRRVQKTGIAAAAVGFCATSLLILIDIVLGGAPSWTSVITLAAFLVLGAIVWKLDRLQHVALQWINGTLKRRAARMLKEVGRRAPARVRYEIDGDEIRGEWFADEESVASWSHSLGDRSHGLVGEVCIAVFKHSRALRPTVFCFFSDSQQSSQLQSVLAAGGTTFEELDASMLPDSGVERPWPEEL